MRFVVNDTGYRRPAHLRQDVVHRLARFYVTRPEQPQQPQDLDLEERVGDAAYVVFWRVAGGDEGFEMTDEKRDGFAEGSGRLGVDGAHVGDEGDAGEEDAVVAIGEKGSGAVDEVVEELGHFVNDSHGAEGGLCGSA